MISWVSFLYLDYKCKKIAKEFRGIKMNEALSDLDLILCSAFIGVANVLVGKPFFLFIFLLIIKFIIIIF